MDLTNPERRPWKTASCMEVSKMPVQKSIVRTREQARTGNGKTSWLIITTARLQDTFREMQDSLIFFIAKLLTTLIFEAIHSPMWNCSRRRNFQYGPVLSGAEIDMLGWIFWNVGQDAPAEGCNTRGLTIIQTMIFEEMPSILQRSKKIDVFISKKKSLPLSNQWKIDGSNSCIIFLCEETTLEAFLMLQKFNHHAWSAWMIWRALSIYGRVPKGVQSPQLQTGEQFRLFSI